MSQDLVAANRESWMVIKEQAEEVKKAGLLPANVSSAQAAIIILKGRELGIGPMRALEGLYVVNGKVAMQANLMMSLIRERCPGAVIKTKKKDAKGCILEASRPGQDFETFQFLEEDANRAGLIKPGGPWQKYPVSMYWSRAVTLMARQLFPDILGGAYTPEELGGEHHEDQEPVEVNQEVQPTQPQKPQQTLDRSAQLNARLTGELRVQDVPPVVGQAVPVGKPIGWEEFKAKKEAKVTKHKTTPVKEAKPVEVNEETGEVSGYPEMPTFDKPDETEAVQERPAEEFPDHWAVVATAGGHMGKTMKQIYDEIGKEGMMKMYKSSIKRIAELGKMGQPIPDTVKQTLAAIEKCLE